MKLLGVPTKCLQSVQCGARRPGTALRRPGHIKSQNPSIIELVSLESIGFIIVTLRCQGNVV